MLIATMKPVLANNCYIHISQAGCHVKMRDIFYYFLKFKQLVKYNICSIKKQVLLDKFLILYLIYQFLIVSGFCKHVQYVLHRLICFHTIQRFSHNIDSFLFILTQ